MEGKPYEKIVYPVLPGQYYVTAFGTTLLLERIMSGGMSYSWFPALWADKIWIVNGAHVEHFEVKDDTGGITYMDKTNLERYTESGIESILLSMGWL